MKKTTTMIIALLISSVIFTQTNISTNDIVDATTTTCTSVTHVSIYYPKAQKHYSDSLALGNVSGETLYLDAKSKGTIIGGYLDIEVAFMQSNNYVCQVKKYRILTPEYFELTKRNYCVNEVANFAKHRVNYDGNETIYVLDSNQNYIDTGAVYTPLYAGKYYIEYDNAAVGLNYLDSITVNPQPSISFTTPIPNSFNSTRPLNKYLLSSYITHSGVKLESTSPGVILESGGLTVNVEFIGKFHNLMKYTTVSGKGCRNSLTDTIFIKDGLTSSNCPAPLLNTPTFSSIFDYVKSTHNFSSIPMCLKRQECDGANVALNDRNPYLSGDTNYVHEWYMISENILSKLNSVGSFHTLNIPDNGKNDIIQVLCRTIHKTTLDTSLFFNQIIQTHKKYIKKIEKCNQFGDTNIIAINSATLESDYKNYYWRTGSFDRASYDAANLFTGYYKPNNTWVASNNIVNENTAKINSYRIEYNQIFPANENIEWMHSYDPSTNLVRSGSFDYSPNVVSNSGNGCYRQDTIQLILKPKVDINYTATLNTGGLVPLGGSINHSVNNISPGSSYNLNYFSDTTSGANGNYITKKPGYIHSGYKVTDQYGCSSDSTAYNLFEVDLPLGISELNSSEVTVFPNPFTNQITIETENIGKSNIRIYSMYGSLVYQSTKNMGGSRTIKVPNNLPKGTYILRVVGDKKGFTKRITKL